MQNYLPSTSSLESKVSMKNHFRFSLSNDKLTKHRQIRKTGITDASAYLHYYVEYPLNLFHKKYSMSFLGSKITKYKYGFNDTTKLFTLFALLGNTSNSTTHNRVSNHNGSRLQTIVAYCNVSTDLLPHISLVLFYPISQLSTPHIIGYSTGALRKCRKSKKVYIICRTNVTNKRRVDPKHNDIELHPFVYNKFLKLLRYKKRQMTLYTTLIRKSVGQVLSTSKQIEIESFTGI